MTAPVTRPVTPSPAAAPAHRLRSLALAATAIGVIAVLVLFAHPVETAEARAEAVTRDFFAAMTERKWDEACALLSEDFYERNNLTNDTVCFMALHLGFTLRENFVFEMGDVERRGPELLVHARADGEPGVIRLVDERGALRIDSLLAE